MTHVDSDRLQAFAEDALPPAEREAVSAHLESCPRCRAESEGWAVLFGGLDELGDVAPSPDFSHRVIERLPESVLRRRSLGSRLLEVVRAPIRRRLGTAAAVHEHVDSNRLQDFLDGALDVKGTREVEVHLDTCRPCREEAESWRGLIVALSAAPRFEPSEAFTERVMAHVRIQTAVSLAHASVRERTRRWFELNPRMKARVAALTGATVPPVALALMAAYTVVSNPLVSLETLLGYFSVRSESGLLGRAVEVLRAGTLPGLGDLPASIGSSPGVVVAAVGVFIALSALSTWVLYRNLIWLPRRRESRYVHSL